MKVVAIVGPTASGKTGLSLDIAGGLFEVISADSVQVYRFMDIGSGKPTKEELSRVRHYLIDIVNPDVNFTAGDFSIKAAEALEEIAAKKRFPLLVGGTGFYLNSLLYGIDDIPDIGESVKNQVAYDYDNIGSQYVYDELMKADPVFSSKVHKNDRQRVIRGLSVYRATGRPISGYYNIGNKNSGYEALIIGLYVEKDLLIERIAARTDLMIKNGFVEEVEGLRSMGYSPLLNSMQSIGYYEINCYIDGKVSLEEAIFNIKKNTIRYAKKQMTWFRKNKSVIWFDQDKIKKIPDLIDRWIN